MKKLIITFILVSISTCILYSQNREIKGRVIDNHQLNALGYVAILIQDTLQVGRTDLSGYFQIEIPVNESVLKFMAVGMEPAIIEMTGKCVELEVVMIFSGSYDFTTPKKVDRLRYKKYKELPKLYREAFEKGIFTSPNVCNKQSFIPYFRKKQS